MERGTRHASLVWMCSMESMESNYSMDSIRSILSIQSTRSPLLLGFHKLCHELSRTLKSKRVE